MTTVLDPRMAAAVEAHLDTAEAIAWAFFTRTPAGDLDELKSITLEALVKAAGRWIDPYCSSRGFDPWDKADPSKPESHFSGYCIKFMKGSLLDYARSSDRLTRSTRHAVKALQRAFDDGCRGEAEMARAAGVTVTKAREVLAADAAVTVSLDGNAFGERGDSPVMLTDRDPVADVEGQVVVSDLLSSFMTAFDRLPAIQQVLVAFVFHQELDIADAAGLVYLEPDEARRELEAAVLSVHRTLLQAVTIS